MSWRKYSRHGVCKSRGRTFIADPGFLFGAPVNGVDYKSLKKEPLPTKLGKGQGPYVMMRVITIKSDVTIRGNVSF